MAFTVINESSKYNRRFKLTQQVIVFKLNKLDDGAPVTNAEQWFKDGLRAIYDQSVRSLNPTDKVGMTFSAMDFDGDFHIPFKQVDQL